MKLKSIALIMGGAASLAGCGGSTDEGPLETYQPPQLGELSDPTIDPTLVEYNDIPVHDPSVIRTDDGTFHVIGSHMAMASSTDLVNWTQTSPGFDPAAPDFSGQSIMSNYETVAAEGIDWVGGHLGSWASDIIQLEDGNYYFYYNHCATPADPATDPDSVCDASRSYLGVAKSSDIMGPYENVDLFLVSGHITEAELEEWPLPQDEEGNTVPYNGNQHPNTIDPDAFYDANGNLWMVYGSYSGGIYILAMDESTGLPEEGQGYGKKLMGGSFAPIEGPYVLYSPESEYYYLFTSFGGFNAEDGYNIRVSRSRTPDGPYLDAAGNNMLSATNNDNFTDFGVKLMGGFNFQSLPGDPLPSRGYLSPGHNSAYYDAETGQHFLITHTRFPNRGQQHAIRVHEMWINDDGWLVASPQRYAPIEGNLVTDPEDLVGDYKFINHGKDNNRTANQSMAITLTEGRGIEGEVTGSYRLYYEQPGRIGIFLDDGSYYDGVARWQWHDRAEQLVPVFTALDNSGEGVMVWGVQQPEMSNGEILQSIADELEYPSTFKGDSIDLPTQGTRGAEISWSTTNGNVIKSDGTVLRPAAGEGDATLSLTATITRNGDTQEKTFDITVPERLPYNRVASYEFEGNLADSLSITGDASAIGRYPWVENGTVAYATGRDGQAVQFDGANGVKLPSDLITNYEYTVSLWVRPEVITVNTPTFFGAATPPNIEENPEAVSDRWLSFLPQGWTGNTMLWSHNLTESSEAWFDGSTDVRIPVDEWSHMAFSVDQGYVRVYINGEEMYAGGNVADFFTETGGVFTLGVNYWEPDVPYVGLIDDLRVYEAALSAGEVDALDVEELAPSELVNTVQDILSLGDLSSVVDDIHLPVTGPYASNIEWTSSQPSVISVEADTGVVTRPPEGSTPAEVTLTATISLGGQNVTKDFQATVRPIGPPEPVAVYSFEGDLTESTGNFGAGTVTADRLDNTGGTITYEDGAVGTAIFLDGSSGVRLPDNLIKDATYTFQLWINPSSLAQHTPAFFGQANENSWVSVVPFGPGAGNTMLWSGTAWFDGDTGTQIPVDTWTHFVAVNNAGTLTLYLNGEQVFRGVNFPDVFSVSEAKEFGIGVNNFAPDAPFHGYVDELKIYDDPASASNVQTWYEEATAE